MPVDLKKIKSILKNYHELGIEDIEDLITEIETLRKQVKQLKLKQRLLLADLDEMLP